MTLARLRTAPIDVPAFVVERVDRTALAWHPSGRDDHPNLVATVERLAARGFAVAISARPLALAA